MGFGLVPTHPKHVKHPVGMVEKIRNHPILGSYQTPTWSLNMSGWWLSHPSEKYEFVSWDDYSQCMEK